MMSCHVFFFKFSSSSINNINPLINSIDQQQTTKQRHVFFFERKKMNKILTNVKKNGNRKTFFFVHPKIIQWIHLQFNSGNFTGNKIECIHLCVYMCVCFVCLLHAHLSSLEKPSQTNKIPIYRFGYFDFVSCCCCCRCCR